MLVRDEPLASIITEALEGYASGRFELQAEVKRFLASLDFLASPWNLWASERLEHKKPC